MSLYSIIGLIALVAVSVIGIAVKIILKSKREKLDGVHGFVRSIEDGAEETEELPDDGWRML